jgi:hypothetical protein
MKLLGEVMFRDCGRRAIPTAFGLSAVLVVVTKIEAQPAPYYAAFWRRPIAAMLIGRPTNAVIG